MDVKEKWLEGFSVTDVRRFLLEKFGFDFCCDFGVGEFRVFLFWKLGVRLEKLTDFLKKIRSFLEDDCVELVLIH